MTTSAETASGKGHRDENFPVASFLIHPRHRGVILAFYRFVRAADDVADHPSLPPEEKLALLDRLEQGLLGADVESHVTAPLRQALTERSVAPRHAQDLLTAFRMDVTKLRYRDWDELINYCSYSAMPVGRFVLDVHGESRSTWPVNDALCAALQIINHLQDCAADYRNLDRVYVPLDALERAGTNVEALASPAASPELRQCLQGLAKRTDALLDQSEIFCTLIQDRRLALEVAVIQRVARRLARILQTRDPLSERVHLSAAAFAGFSALGMCQAILRRLTRGRARPGPRPAAS